MLNGLTMLRSDDPADNQPDAYLMGDLRSGGLAPSTRAQRGTSVQEPASFELR